MRLVISKSMPDAQYDDSLNKPDVIMIQKKLIQGRSKKVFKGHFRIMQTIG